MASAATITSSALWCPPTFSSGTMSSPQRVRGFFPNTQLFHIMKAAYGWD
jgi:hypothetical protein